MKTLKEYKEQQMQDLEFAKGYEAIQPELEVIRKRNDTRREDIKNELIYIAKIFNTETKKWEKPLKSSNAFITYKLEEGCMPSDRVINN